jgi:hypothetical protein
VALCQRSRPKPYFYPAPAHRAEIDDYGWYVINGDHGWLCGSRGDALREFDDLVKIERTGAY